MDLNEFSNIYLSKMQDILSKENKSVFLLADFNIDLIKHEKHEPTNEFLDSLIFFTLHFTSNNDPWSIKYSH